MKAEGSYFYKGLYETQGQGVKILILGDNGQSQAGDRILQADAGTNPCSVVMEEGSAVPLEHLQNAFSARTVSCLYLYAGYLKLWRRIQKGKRMLIPISNLSPTPPQKSQFCMFEERPGNLHFKHAPFPLLDPWNACSGWLYGPYT